MAGKDKHLDVKTEMLLRNYGLRFNVLDQEWKQNKESHQQRGKLVAHHLSSLAMSILCCAAAMAVGVSILAAPVAAAAGDVFRTSHASDVGLCGGGVFS